MKAYISSVIRLLAYTGARYVIVAPTNLSPLAESTADVTKMAHLCNATTVALQAAVKRQFASSSASRGPVMPANLPSVRIACLSPSAGVLSTDRRDGEQHSSPPGWSSSLYLFTASQLLAESDYLLGMMENDFGRVVHQLMQGRGVQRGLRAARDAFLPQVYDVSSQTIEKTPPGMWVPPQAPLSRQPSRRSAAVSSKNTLPAAKPGKKAGKQ